MIGRRVGFERKHGHIPTRLFAEQRDQRSAAFGLFDIRGERDDVNAPTGHFCNSFGCSGGFHNPMACHLNRAADHGAIEARSSGDEHGGGLAAR